MKKTYDLAKKILGIDFISPEEIMKSQKGIVYTEEQLVQFGKTIPVQEILELCHDNNCMLVAGPNRPMSLLELRTIDNSLFFLKEGGWYTQQKETFAQNDKVETKWYMICKDIFYRSNYKSWDEQFSLISDAEFVPNASEFAWAITIYRALRFSWLFMEIYARTSSSDSTGCHIYISNFDSGRGFGERKGLTISSYLNNTGARNLGLSVARRLLL